MQPARIEDASVALKPPADWDEERNGHCGQLPIRVEKIDGLSFMFSAWDVQPGEALAILAGGKVRLGISGSVHPVVRLGVDFPQEQLSPVSTIREMMDREGRHCVEVETLWPPLEGSTKAHRGRVQIIVGEGGVPMAAGFGLQQLTDMAKRERWVE